MESESAEEIFLSNSMCRQVYSGLRLMGAHIVYPFLFFLVEITKREKDLTVAKTSTKYLISRMCRQTLPSMAILFACF